MLGQPTVISSGNDNTFNTSTFVTTSVTLSADSTYFLCVISGSANPVPAEPPSSVTGNGLTWTQRGTAPSGNDRVRVSIFSAKGSPTAGSLTVNFATAMDGFGYMLVAIDGAEEIPVQAQTTTTGGPDATIVLNNTVPATSATMGIIGYNSTKELSPGSGYSRVGPDQFIGGPVGTLSVGWLNPGAQVVDYLTPESGTKGFIALEIAESQEAPTGGTFMVVNGVEVPVSVFYVQGGVEIPASLDTQ